MNRSLSLAAVACALAVALTGCSGGGKASGSGTGAKAGGGLVAGHLTVAAPAGWKLEKDEQPDSFRLVVSGACTDQGAGVLTGCRSVQVLGASYLTPDPNADSALPLQPYTPADPHAAQYVQDTGYQCPADAKLRSGSRAEGAKLVTRSTVQVAGRPAQYREWTIPCWSTDPESGQPVKRSATSYTERDWYLADAKVLIVDEWNTPGLQALLTRATWS